MASSWPRELEGHNVGHPMEPGQATETTDRISRVVVVSFVAIVVLVVVVAAAAVVATCLGVCFSLQRARNDSM